MEEHTTMLNPNGTTKIGLSAPDPFNPAALRLDQSFTVGVKKLLRPYRCASRAGRTSCACTLTQLTA